MQESLYAFEFDTKDGGTVTHMAKGLNAIIARATIIDDLVDCGFKDDPLFHHLHYIGKFTQ
jgi:hypothetical protein